MRSPKVFAKQGPWQGQHLGDVDKLKPEYRLALSRDGYALVRCEGAVQAEGVKRGASPGEN